MFERYWIGIVSHEHVKIGVTGGFAQLCHGKSAPLKRMKKGDWLIYYSPKTSMTGAPLQAFTALGQVCGDSPYLFQMSDTFTPHRLDVRYLPSQTAEIMPLLPHLTFIKDLKHWGYPFRFGHFEITQADFLIISNAMKATHE